MKPTPEKLDRLIEAVRQHNSPLPWEIDIERANKKIGELYQALIWARKGLIIHMEMVHLCHVEKTPIIEFADMALKGAETIQEAKLPTVTTPAPGPRDDAPCGYFPDSKSDPRD